MLQIGTALFYYKLGQVLQIRAIITNWGITNANKEREQHNYLFFFKKKEKKINYNIKTTRHRNNYFNLNHYKLLER